jgi:hypothetical protein
MTVGRSPTAMTPSNRFAADLEDRRHRRVLVVKPDRNRLVLPGILDQVTPIGAVDKLHPEPFGRVAERARLISGCRRQYEYALHLCAL